MTDAQNEARDPKAEEEAQDELLDAAFELLRAHLGESEIDLNSLGRAGMFEIQAAKTHPWEPTLQLLMASSAMIRALAIRADADPVEFVDWFLHERQLASADAPDEIEE